MKTIQTILEIIAAALLGLALVTGAAVLHYATR